MPERASKQWVDVDFCKELDPRLLPSCNPADNTLAADLFGEKGFIVVRNFISKGKVARLLETYLSRERLQRRHDTKDYSYSHIHLYCRPREEGVDDWKELREVVQTVYERRASIALQPSSDSLMLRQCLMQGVDPTNLEQVVSSQLNGQGAWLRYAHYRQGDWMSKHLDGPGEIQTMIVLTEKGKDYKAGGLEYCGLEDATVHDLDTQARPGDLVLFNAYRKVHWVKPIELESGQIGRMNLFIPIIPPDLAKAIGNMRDYHDINP